jgi:hypothetical protein
MYSIVQVNVIADRPYSGIRCDFQPLTIPGLLIIRLSEKSDVEMKKTSRERDLMFFIRVRNQNNSEYRKHD